MGGFVVVLFFGGHLIFDCFKLVPIVFDLRSKTLYLFGGDAARTYLSETLDITGVSGLLTVLP